MPIYEYLCQTCSHRFEVKQSIKDDPITSCARCGREVTKLISSPAIMFKGSGWYVTDYSDKLKPAGDKDGAEKKTEKGADGKDAQPATTSAESSPTTPAASKDVATPAASPSSSNATTPTAASSS